MTGNMVWSNNSNNHSECLLDSISGARGVWHTQIWSPHVERADQILRGQKAAERREVAVYLLSSVTSSQIALAAESGPKPGNLLPIPRSNGSEATDY